MAGRLNLIRRRTFLTLSGAGLIAFANVTRAEGQENIQQPADPNADAFLARAFEMKRLAIEKGDQAYGAVVVREGRIIGQSWSRVILDRDPTAHAEMSAIRDAARRTNNRDLSGAILYSSSPPCPMCEGAAFWAGIGRMIHGEPPTDGGRPQLCG